MAITDDFEAYTTGEELDEQTDWVLCGRGQDANPGVIEIIDTGGDARIEYTNYAYSGGYTSRGVARDGTFDDDHYAELVLDVLGSVASFGPAVRIAGDGGEGSCEGYNGTVASGFAEVNEAVTSGEAVQLGQAFPTPAATDLWRLTCSGTSLDFSQDATDRVSVTDATWTSGAPGVMGMAATDTTEWDGFECSDEVSSGVTGTGSLVYGHSTTATGTVVVNGTGSLVYGYTTTGTGTVATEITGTGALVYGYTVTATGTVVVNGMGALVYGYSVAGTGTVAGEKTGTGALVYGHSTTATGTVVVNGTGSLVYGYTVTATGTVLGEKTGTGALVYGYTVTATGTVLGAYDPVSARFAMARPVLTVGRARVMTRYGGATQPTTAEPAVVV